MAVYVCQPTRTGNAHPSCGMVAPAASGAGIPARCACPERRRRGRSLRRLPELQPPRPGGGDEPPRSARAVGLRCFRIGEHPRGRPAGSTVCRRRWMPAAASSSWWAATGCGAGSGPSPRSRSTATSVPTTTRSAGRSFRSCSARPILPASSLPAAVSGDAVERDRCAARAPARPGPRSHHLASKATFEGCPFVGPDVFRIDQAHLFFGRRRKLWTRWPASTGAPGTRRPLARDHRQQRVRQVSLMNAGLLPLVDQGWLWPRTGFEAGGGSAR